MPTKMKVVFEDETVRLTRKGSNGRDDPTMIVIEALPVVGRPDHPWQHRRLHLTIDELFRITEALDDLCDYIEDNG